MITFPTISNFFSQMYEDAKEHVKERTEYVMDPKQWDLSKSLPYPTDVFIKNKELGSEKVNEALGEALQYVTPGGKLAALAGTMVTKTKAAEAIRMVSPIKARAKNAAEEAAIETLNKRMTTQPGYENLKLIAEDMKRYASTSTSNKKISPSTLFELTGAWKDPTGQMKVWIPDVDAKLKLDYEELKDATKGGSILLRNAIEHPTIEALLPGTKNVNLVVEDLKAPGTYGMYQSKGDTIFINEEYFDNMLKGYKARGTTNKRLLEAILHERQHGLQEYLGMPQGAAVEIFKQKGLNDVDAMSAYRRLLGEIEARFAEKNSHLGREWRTQGHPLSEYFSMAASEKELSEEAIRKLKLREMGSDEFLHEFNPTTLMLHRHGEPRYSPEGGLTIEEILKGVSSY